MIYIIVSKIKSETSKEFQSKFSFFDSSDRIDIDIDYVLAVGGDGTIVRSITYVKDSGVPVFGINAGRLGSVNWRTKREYR
jgi:Predicted sugar kinase